MKLLDTVTEDCQVCMHSRAIWSIENSDVRWYCEDNRQPINGDCDYFYREPDV